MRKVHSAPGDEPLKLTMLRKEIMPTFKTISLKRSHSP
jgi:hypothetical protein